MKLLVAPLLAAGALIALALAGAKAETYDVNVAYHCAFSVAREDRPAADILILGNSQSGAAIDPAYLGTLGTGDESRTAEKLSIVGSDIMPYRLIVDEYMKHRGTPKLVVLQPLFRRGDSQAVPPGAPTPGAPVHPRPNIAFGQWQTLQAVRANAVHDTGKAPLPYWARSGYRNTVRLWTDRQVERIVAALSYTRSKVLRNFCKTDERFRMAGNWPYDDLPLQPGDASGPTLDDDGRSYWKERMDRRTALDLSAPARTFEIDQNKQLIADLEAAGARVVLVGYPSLDRAQADASELALYRRVLGRDIVNLYDELDADTRARLDANYRDPVHVNFAGAQILTEALAASLDKRVP